MTQYRLRTLVIATAIGPPLLAIGSWAWQIAGEAALAVGEVVLAIVGLLAFAALPGALCGLLLLLTYWATAGMVWVVEKVIPRADQPPAPHRP
jgi:hypothetical protein